MDEIIDLSEELNDQLKIKEEDQERYDFLYQQSMEMFPEVSSWIIHISVLDQIREEKGEDEITDEQLQELAEKYKN